MNKFETLIGELGHILNIPLEAEHGFLCKLNIKEKVHLQIEYDEASEKIILVCFVCEVPPGKFREQTLIAALKANHQDISLGSFSYVEGSQTLILQHYLPISVAAALLGTLLQQFTDKAIVWKEAIEQGNVSLLVPSAPSSLPSPLSFT